ncbi:MAG: hypothetical protein EBZ62_07870 [Sphingobacteriia bacterium]|nr:hypothetical protein [Sphingobacteriia bacterium]
MGSKPRLFRLHWFLSILLMRSNQLDLGKDFLPSSIHYLNLHCMLLTCSLGLLDCFRLPTR